MNFILKNENAVYYECGYSCDNCAFVRLGEKAFFLTDGRYAIEAREIIKNAEILQTRSALSDEIRALLRREKVKKIAFDPHDFSYAEFKRLSDHSHVYFAAKPHFSKLKRIVKSAREIELLKQAARLGAQKFSEFAQFLNAAGEGLSEKELFYNANLIFTDRGNLDLSFSPIVAINQNAAKAHALPSGDVLRRGDLLLLDAGVKFNRYCSDRTRTALFGGANGTSADGTGSANGKNSTSGADGKKFSSEEDRQNFSSVPGEQNSDFEAAGQNLNAGPCGQNFSLKLAAEGQNFNSAVRAKSCGRAEELAQTRLYAQDMQSKAPSDLAFAKDQKFASQKQNEIYEIVREAQAAAIKAVRAGVRACDVDFAARDFIAKQGYGEAFFHSTGHGVGLDIHELPLISPRDKTVLREGMVFSVEPGIYLAGEFGVRIEDVVVVTAGGCEILSE